MGCCPNTHYHYYYYHYYYYYCPVLLFTVWFDHLQSSWILPILSSAIIHCFSITSRLPELCRLCSRGTLSHLAHLKTWWVCPPLSFSFSFSLTWLISVLLSLFLLYQRHLELFSKTGNICACKFSPSISPDLQWSTFSKTSCWLNLQPVILKVQSTHLNFFIFVASILC